MTTRLSTLTSQDDYFIRVIDDLKENFGELITVLAVNRSQVRQKAPEKISEIQGLLTSVCLSVQESTGKHLEIFHQICSIHANLTYVNARLLRSECSRASEFQHIGQVQGMLAALHHDCSAVKEEIKSNKRELNPDNSDEAHWLHRIEQKSRPK